MDNTYKIIVERRIRNKYRTCESLIFNADIKNKKEDLNKIFNKSLLVIQDWEDSFKNNTKK